MTVDTKDVDRLSPLLVTADEAGTLLTVSKDTILNLYRCKALVGVKVGRHLRFRRPDLEKFVEGLGSDGRA